MNPRKEKAPREKPAPRWDEVDETSWESFPASDSPSWATPGPAAETPRPRRPPRGVAGKKSGGRRH